MPTFTFKGFTAGSSVALSAAQGASNASGSVPTWGQGNLASATIATVAPDTITAPAGIWFEATDLAGFGVPSGPGAGESYDPSFHEITYVWTVRSAPLTPYSAPQNMVTGWNDANIAYGKKVAFHFTDPGTYTVDLWAVDEFGTSASAETTFTVVDANSVYPGASTVCFSISGSETWAGEFPGCQRATSFNALQSAVNSASGPLRILFKRGQSVPNTAVSRILANGSGEWLNHVGAWGSGAKPIINCPKDSNTFYLAGPANPITQFTCENIDFRGSWDAASETGMPGTMPFHFLNTPNDTFYTISQCDFSGLEACWFGTGPNNCNLIVADCVATNWRDYGAFLHPSPNTSFAMIGSRFQQNVDAQNGSPNNIGKNGLYNDHGPFRYSHLQHCYLACNDYFSRNGWSNLAPDSADQPCLRMNQDAMGDVTSIIDRCVAEGGFHVIAYSGQNGSTAENPGNHLIDRALMIASAKTAYDFVFTEFGGTTVRNSIGIQPDTPDYHNGLGWGGAVRLEADNPINGNLNNKIRVYGNTFLNLRSGANDPGDPWPALANVAGFSDVTVENNVLHGPDLDTPVTAAGSLDLTTVIPGVTPRYKGVLYNEFGQETGNLSATVPNGSSFTLPYPAGTNQSYWQAIQGIDTQHTIRANNTRFYSELGEFSVAYEASQVRVTNTSGATWNSGSSWILKLDRKSQRSPIPSTYANPSTLPLPRPLAAIGGTLGLMPYDDFENAERNISPSAGALQP